MLRATPLSSHHRVTLSLQVSAHGFSTRLSIFVLKLLGFRLISLEKTRGEKNPLVWALLCPEQLFCKPLHVRNSLSLRNKLLCVCSLMLTPEQESLAKHPVSWSVTQKLEALNSAQQEQLNHSSVSDGTITSPLQLALTYHYSQSCFQEQRRSHA